jgi:hypothetical protein
MTIEFQLTHHFVQVEAALEHSKEVVRSHLALKAPIYAHHSERTFDLHFDCATDTSNGERYD